MRKCCGYYCAMIAVVAIFFYGVMIAMEVRKNQFVMFKLQFPEGNTTALDPADHWYNLPSKNAEEVRKLAEDEADHKVTSMAIAIGLNVLCIIGCLVQVKLLEKREAAEARENERKLEEEAKEH